MDAAAVFRRLSNAGIYLEMAADHLTACPASRLNNDLRALIRSNKPELIAYMVEAHQTTLELIEAAMRCCDHHGDGPEARAAMVRDIQATPADLQGDLLRHFNETYPPDEPPEGAP